jgi:dipeptidyl-peptidase-4
MSDGSPTYPQLKARTRRFTSGAPRQIAISGDGARVVFLRSTSGEDPVDRLWALDVATGNERLVADPLRLLGTRGGEAGEADPDVPDSERALRERQRLVTDGIGEYATDRAGRLAAFQIHGRLFRADLDSGEVRELPTGAPALDPRPDPTGRRVAYVADRGLAVIDEHGDPRILAREDGDALVSWGSAEFIAAEEFDRYRGYWWAPDGATILATRTDESPVPRWYLHDPGEPDQPPRPVHYPPAGGANALVTLHLLPIDGGRVDVSWDTEKYPYLVTADWDEHGPLVTVLDRRQRHGLVLGIDPRTGATEVLDELSDPLWIVMVDGAPRRLPSGEILTVRDTVADGRSCRALFAGGHRLTPPDLYVRRVAGPTGPAGVVVEASQDDPSQQHLWLVGAAGDREARRLTRAPGWHTGVTGNDTLVVGSASLDGDRASWAVIRSGEPVAAIRSLSAAPPYAPRPVLQRVTDRGLPAAVVYPRGHRPGAPLPVLVDVYGGPGHQLVVAGRARWQEPQWWAEAGYAVVTVDNRGTPGVSPAFEKAIHDHMADVVLADQVDALTALLDAHPDLDRQRVAIRGWSYGGWLAGLAVLRRPDVYRCGVAGAPVTDWGLYDSAYTERYLGLPGNGNPRYPRNSLVELAATPPARPADARPLLLVHGIADDNVVAAHTLRLSAALFGAGRPHSVLMLPGATHMVAGAATERLLEWELDFVSRHLS